MGGSNGEPWWPVPADYDGLGRAQRAIFGPLGWRIDGHPDPIAFTDSQTGPSGGGLLYPAAADYDGDGKADLSFVTGTSWRTRSSRDPSVVTTRTVPTYRSYDGPHAVMFGYAQYVNVGRLTLIGKNCDPGSFDYPKNC